MTSVPPIEPALLRAIFDDESPAIPRAVQPRKGPPMRRFLIVFAAAFAVTPLAAASPPPSDLKLVSTLVVPCREGVRANYRGDPSVMRRYLAALSTNREKRQAEIVVCTAYLIAVDDVVQGRLIPVDPD